jgi:hypothetical protein
MVRPALAARGTARSLSRNKCLPKRLASVCRVVISRNDSIKRAVGSAAHSDAFHPVSQLPDCWSSSQLRCPAGDKR